MNNDDLRPLDGPDGEAPEALVRALRALGRERPGELAMAAAALRLDASLEHTQLAAHAARPWASLGGKLLAGALVIGAAALALRPATPAAERRAESTTQHAAPTNRASEPISQETMVERTPVGRFAEEEPTREPRALAVDRQVDVGTSAPMPPHGRAVPARRRSPDHATRPAAEPATASSVTSTNTTTQAPAVARALSPSGEDAPVLTQQKEERPARAADSELSLLLEARRHVHDDPEATLRATSEHARRFPGGALAPEREVLAIRALRALGQSHEAAQRVARFRAAFPTSVHLSGLDAR